MPDPAWTFEYNMSQSPAQNNFTERLIRSPVVTYQTSGNPANRRIEVDSTNGDAIWLSSTVPSLDLSLGTTMEWLASVNGPVFGDIGVELRFGDRAASVVAYPDAIDWIINGQGPQPPDVSPIPTPNNGGDVLWRLLLNPSPNPTMEVYRAGVQVIAPLSVPLSSTHPFEQILFFCEGGATGIFRELKIFLAGAVVPG